MLIAAAPRIRQRPKAPVPPILLFLQALQASQAATSSTLWLPPQRKSRREAHRLYDARVIGHAAAGDVERGAVIDRGANDRQSERDVDGASKGQQLHRDQALVVIAG